MDGKIDGRTKWHETEAGKAHLRRIQPLAWAGRREKARRRRLENPEGQTKAIEILLSLQQIATLDALARTLKVRRSRLIREAVDLWLEQFK